MESNIHNMRKPIFPSPYYSLLVWLQALLVLSTVIEARHLRHLQQETTAKRRVVVTLTTSPHRILTLQPTIDSLLNRQSEPPDILQINLPRVFERTKTAYPNDTDLPDWLTKNKKIRLHHIENDYGPITKLLPVLDTERDPNTIIVVVDDDTAYTKWVVEYMSTLAYASGGNFSVTAHCGDWAFLKHHQFSRLNVQHENRTSPVFVRLLEKFQMLPSFPKSQPCCCQVLEAYASAAYQRRIFNLTPFIPAMNRTITFREYVDIALKNENCFISDDWVVSNFLRLNEVFAIDVTGIMKFIQLPSGLSGGDGEGLHKLQSNGRYRYKRCWTYLEKHGLSGFVHQHAGENDDDI